MEPMIQVGTLFQLRPMGVAVYRVVAISIDGGMFFCYDVDRPSRVDTWTPEELASENVVILDGPGREG